MIKKIGLLKFSIELFRQWGSLYDSAGYDG